MLSVSRRPCEISHPKLEEYIVEDFMTLPIADPKLQGYYACFFCAGKSNIGMSKEDYYHLSYEITMHFAKAIGQKRLQGWGKYHWLFTWIPGFSNTIEEVAKAMISCVKCGYFRRIVDVRDIDTLSKCGVKLNL